LIFFDLPYLLRQIDGTMVPTPMATLRRREHCRAATVPVRHRDADPLALEPQPLQDDDVDAAVTECRRADASFVRRSGVMQRALALATEVAEGDDVVMLAGEPGTGRHRLAGYIHSASLRRQRPLLQVDVSLMVNGLDHRLRDAFSRADRGGILFQNVELLPPPLLQVLGQVITRYKASGAKWGTAEGVRVLTTTSLTADAVPANVIARELMMHGLARAVPVPPLRERRPDMPDLVEELLAQLCDERGRSGCGVSGDAMDSIECHFWPDNVRELRDVLHRALVTVGDGDVIDVPQLPRRIRAATEPSSDDDATLEGVEKRHILAVATRLGWHREATARALGISVSTLARRLHEYGLARGYEAAGGE